MSRKMQETRMSVFVDNRDEVIDSHPNTVNLPHLEDEKLEKIENLLIRSETDDALHTVVSALYGKLLVVMGVAFPIIDAISPDNFTRFNGFYLCLYIGSVTFMIYTYVLLLKAEAETGIGVNSETQRNKSTRYGSSYLRVGVAGFGIGSMIFSGLELGRYFEINPKAECHSLLIAISPLARIIFVLMQMLYIFSNGKLQVLVDGRNRFYNKLVKFGLMHMIATNLCEWLYVLVEETKQDIFRAQHIRNDRGVVVNKGNGSLNDTTRCWKSHIMRSLIQNSSPYLFPCTVEYSLLCSVILGVMWHKLSQASKAQNVMKRQVHLKAPKAQLDNSQALLLLTNRQSGVNVIYANTNVSRFSVDCTNSHKGLFSGILVLVLTIISLIMFFELVNINIELAVLQVNIWETALFATAITATVACAVILRNVGYRRESRELELEHFLLLVTQCGVFLYFLFQIFGGYHYLQNDNNTDLSRLLRMVAPMAALIQSSCQTVLILDARRRQCLDCTQYRKKPGRQLVTFLLVCNLALWIINRLKNNSAEFHPMQMDFYGTWGWTVITHVTIPLVVCYRFQSTVCLYEIWKHVYKNPRRVTHFYAPRITTQ